jgi:tRNA-modifying protein YgfZ
MNLEPFPDQNRPDRAVVSMSGDGVVAFLDNLLTCDLGGLTEKHAAYGALLSPQGKILHDIFVYHGGGQILIDCAAEQRAALVTKLAMYRLRAKFVIEINNDLEIGVHMNKPDDGMAYADPRHGEMGWRSFSPVGSYINVPGYRGHEEHRIELGLADSVRDIGVELLFPHEVNLDQFGGVSFTKGCYVGQEVVSRMQHRGTARNRMLPVRTNGEMQRGDKITSNGKVIGEIYSTAGDQALALLRIDRLADATAPLKAGAERVDVDVPSWIMYDVKIPEAAR